jgi:pimeloyl-ACP methyl ester carboxylesterase
MQSMSDPVGLYVPIGGLEQFLRIGGSGPVLLYVHGGGGGISRPAAAAWAPWEEHFTVVHWDQRGAGRTLGRNGPARCTPITMDQLVRDGIEVAAFLINHLKQPKVLLVGHSFGSAIAVMMLHKRPELFSAYVGTGQFVTTRRMFDGNYRRTVGNAERLGDAEALKTLRDIGPPPYTDLGKVKTFITLRDQLAAAADSGEGDPVPPRPFPKALDFTAEDSKLMKEGMAFIRGQTYDEFSELDLPSLGLKFSVPMFFFHGAADPSTPCEMAEAFFAAIEAPHKEFVRFEHYHHFFQVNRPLDFLRELLARVRPLI